MLAIWFLILLPFLNTAWTSGSSQFTYCWSLAWRILSITLLACEMRVIVRLLATTPHPPTEQMTHKLENNYSKEVLTLLQKFWSPQQISKSGDLAKGLRTIGNLICRPVGFDYRTSMGLEKQTLGGHKQNLMHTKTQEKGAVTPQKAETDFPVSVQESPVEAWVHSQRHCI